MSFVTRSTPLNFTLSEVSNIWKVSLALQIDSEDNSIAKSTWIWYLTKNTNFHFSVRYEFGTKRCSNCNRSVSMNRSYLFRQKTDYFQDFKPLLEKWKLKRKFSDYLGQNIFRLCQFLAQFFFTTSETKLEYYHQNVSARVPSRDAKRLKT